MTAAVLSSDLDAVLSEAFPDDRSLIERVLLLDPRAA